MRYMGLLLFIAITVGCGRTRAFNPPDADVGDAMDASDLNGDR